jgi:hypothetical protein
MWRRDTGTTAGGTPALLMSRHWLGVWTLFDFAADQKQEQDSENRVHTHKPK